MDDMIKVVISVNMILYMSVIYIFTSKRMHGMNQTEAASFIISDIIPKVNYLSSHVSTCRRPIL